MSALAFFFIALAALSPSALSVTTIPPGATSAKCARVAPLANTTNLIVRGGSVLTLAPADDSLIPDAVVHICDGRVAFVGPAADYARANTPGALCRAPTLRLGARDVVVPAFINAHTHAAMSLFKNLGNDRDLSDWLNNYIFPLEGALADERFCRVGATLAMAEFLSSGVSTFADMYFFQTHVAEEVARVGMRAFLGQSVIDFPQPDGATPNDTLRVAEAYLRRWSGHPLVAPLVAPHAPYTTSEWVYRAAVALNRRHGARTWSHCAETASENADFRAHQRLPANSSETATQWLHRIGALGADVTCAHAVALSDADIALLRETGTSAAHCPSSNLKLASGFMRYSALRAAGVNVALGTDGQSSNNDVDVVEEARLASLIHKGVDLNPRTLPALDALRMLTVGGARAVGRAREQGSIERGKFGDLAIFRGSSVKWMPRYDVGANGTRSADDTAALIVYNSNAYDVRATVVNGRVLYKDGCFPTIAIDALMGAVSEIGGKVRAYLAAQSTETST